jgi:low affinity Fe/Cu permease
MAQPLSQRLSCQFERLATWSAEVLGRASAFGLACLACALWAMSGPLFSFSNTWQLVINTGTTVLTFLFMFLFQHTQNRDTKALQAKLAELIRVNPQADNALMDIERRGEHEIDAIRQRQGGACEPEGHGR